MREWRELSAGRLLAIRREVLRETEDALERDLLCNAAVLAESLTEDGERVYPDGEAVLGALSCREMEELLRGMVGYLENRRTLAGENVEVRYVFQDFSSVPAFYRIPEGRTKPFGTVHALLCAAEAVDGPFCVINADDYYGIDAYRTIYEELVKLPEDGKATMVGYLLKNTASLYGSVSRGCCTVEDGKLRSIRETLKIQLYEDGSLKDLTTDQPLSPETVVSMNFWGFSETIFPRLRAYFENFLRNDAGENLKAECLLPVMVGEELEKGTLEVSVLHSADRWFGMTYHEDRARVAEELRKLHAAGAYPATLRD